MRKLILLIILCTVTGLLWSEEVIEPEIVSLDSQVVLKPEVTFLEFGSTTCIPCKMMEEVMDEVRSAYSEQVEVVFHNVNEERELAVEYGIKMIPTQIFLDREGKEFHRHVGYYPSEEIGKVLLERGIKPVVKE
ncbi:MAG: thioredoxin family protein [Candidatus Cloacimonetes bacterium]|nr:thioredoxin family protein [Candidatus Cloacimonadota bacterium]